MLAEGIEKVVRTKFQIAAEAFGVCKHFLKISKLKDKKDTQFKYTLKMSG